MEIHENSYNSSNQVIVAGELAKSSYIHFQ